MSISTRLAYIALLLTTLGAACSSQQRRPNGDTGLNAAFYHRFYQGYRLNSVTAERFEKIINTQFLPLFTAAHPEGLHAYRPALPGSPKGCTLPAEIALLTFESETKYSNYRETEIGKKIRDAHTLVFNSDTSKSLVPEGYAGTVLVGHAYVTNPSFTAYLESGSTMVVHCGMKSNEDLGPALSRAYGTGSAASNIVFSASPQHLVEYLFADAPVDEAMLLRERKDRLSGLYHQTLLVPLAKIRIGERRVRTGHGLDAQW